MRRALGAAAAVTFSLGLLACGGDGGDQAGGEPPLTPPPAIPAQNAQTVPQRPEAEENGAVQLGRPDPRRFRVGTPQRAAAGFMSAWGDRAWDRMATWTARSFTTDFPDAGAVLRVRFDDRRLRGWVLRDAQVHANTAVIDVLVAYRTIAPQIHRTRLRLSLEREDARGQRVLRGGRWGVLPAQSELG